MILGIPNTLSVVSSCWRNAEVNLRTAIQTKYHDLDEECVTKLFYGEFAFALREASSEGLIRNSFLLDLRRSYPELADCPELDDIPNGLIADLSLHKKQVERLTGGDLGFTIVRPEINYSPYNQSELIIEEYQRGILCQAKMKKRDGKWGRLTKNQKSLFPDRMDYATLLLYSYVDQSRQQLNKFEWHLCENASIETIERHLRCGKFPSLKNSEEIIELLGNGYIGTDAPDVIKLNIRPSIMLRIFWPPDRAPGNYVRIYQNIQQVQEEQQYLHQT